MDFKNIAVCLPDIAISELKIGFFYLLKSALLVSHCRNETTA